MEVVVMRNLVMGVYGVGRPWWRRNGVVEELEEVVMDFVKLVEIEREIGGLW